MFNKTGGRSVACAVFVCRHGANEKVWHYLFVRGVEMLLPSEHVR